MNTTLPSPYYSINSLKTRTYIFVSLSLSIIGWKFQFNNIRFSYLFKKIWCKIKRNNLFRILIVLIKFSSLFYDHILTCFYSPSPFLLSLSIISPFKLCLMILLYKQCDFYLIICLYDMNVCFICYIYEW